MPFAITISPNQFHQPRFVEQVRDAIQRCGVSPESIELEITEGVVMRNVSDTIEKMEKLKGMGLRLSLDDFGTGYSSLSYLKRLPLDQIKIDRSFARDITTDPNDAAIVETIISMARHMNLGVVAERVETEDQLAFLRARGCTVIQGYYFSRPVAPAEFQGMLEKQCSRVSGAESA